jgi:hypothetical protein
MTSRELYEQTIKPLSAAERLQIASFILSDITAAPVDFSYEWTDEDLQDFSASTWERVESAMGETNAEAG